jgi:hypothetical protein
MTRIPEFVMGLFLSTILRGPELMDKPFDKKETAICRQMERYKKDLIDPKDGSLNVVFVYPGSLGGPDFVGVRTGSFSKKMKMLVVQVAVPADVISSKDFVKHYLLFLKDALEKGKKYLDKKGISFSLEDHIALAEKSVEGLVEME